MEQKNWIKKWLGFIFITVLLSTLFTIQGYLKLKEARAFLDAMNRIEHVKEVIYIEKDKDASYTYHVENVKEVQNSLQVRYVFDKYEDEVKNNCINLHGSLIYGEPGDVITTAEIWELNEGFAYDATILPFITMVNGVPSILKIENRYCKLNGNTFEFLEGQIVVQ